MLQQVPTWVRPTGSPAVFSGKHSFLGGIENVSHLGISCCRSCQPNPQTVSILSTFFFAMMLHPAAQQCAQREIDTVTKQARLPTLDDRSALPFIDCIIKELLRWATPAPMTFPHVQDEDAMYDGMFVPRGATILVNTW